MPVFRNRSAIRVGKKLNAYLNLEAGVTRGDAPSASRNGEAAVETPVPVREIAADKTPMFFIVGQPKSGTSWLMNLLHSHPEIFCRGEGKLFGKDSTRSLHGALAKSKQLETWLTRNPWTWTDEDPDLDEIFRVMVEYLMAKKLSRTRKRMVGDKSPFMGTQEVGEIAKILPGSKVIQIIRDGRDVCVSTVHHLWNNAQDEGGGIPLTDAQIAKRTAFRENPSSFGADGESIFAEGQAAEIAVQWRDRVGSATRDGENLLGDDYLQIFYEDMLTNPVENASRVISFLGANNDERVVRECVDAVSFEKKANRKPGEEDAKSFYRKGVAGDWKSVFTEADKLAYKKEAGEFLIELGYEHDAGW